MEHVDQQLITGLQRGDLTAFEELYRQYYLFLCLVAEHIVRDPSDAREIVSDVFMRLWDIREKIEINTSLKGYLVKAVRNTSFNFLGQKKRNGYLTGRLDESDYVDWEIIEGLKFKSVLGVDNQSRRTGTYEDYMCTANYQFGRGSSFSALNSESFGYTFENTLNYTFTLSGKQLRHI